MNTKQFLKTVQVWSLNTSVTKPRYFDLNLDFTHTMDLSLEGCDLETEDIDIVQAIMKGKNKPKVNSVLIPIDLRHGVGTSIWKVEKSGVEEVSLDLIRAQQNADKLDKEASALAKSFYKKAKLKRATTFFNIWFPKAAPSPDDNGFYWVSVKNKIESVVTRLKAENWHVLECINGEYVLTSYAKGFEGCRVEVSNDDQIEGRTLVSIF